MVNEIGDSLERAREISPVFLKQEELKVDTGGISSIEKSRGVKPEIIPPMDSPILTAPNEKCTAYAVASIDSFGVPVVSTVYTFILKGEEVKNSVLDGWMKNLRDIENYIRQLLASPLYQQLQDIRRLGASREGAVSGIEGASSSKSTGSDGKVELLSTLDRLQVLEKVPPTAEVSDTSVPNNGSRVLVLPLTAALLAGAGLTIGIEAMHSIHPLGEVATMIESITPLFPSVGVHDLVPLINLMIVGPLYYNSWNDAVSNLKNRQGANHLPTILNFSRDVIKIIADPHFVKNTLLQCIKGADQLSEEDQNRLARLLKVVLIGVSLSLLYSVGVGKIQRGKFGGIEPEELRDLLLGKFENLPDPSHKKDLKDELTSKLIVLAWSQLNPLSVGDRTVAVEMLLSYLSHQKDLDPMLNPAKVFEAAIAASEYEPKDKYRPFKV